MANRRGTLGRGLGALLGNQALTFINNQNKDVVEEIPISNIRPNRHQSRRNFEPEAMKDLAESIRSYGVLQPILVRKINEREYEIIAGERRVNAAKNIGLETIPAIVREYTDAQMREISLIENLQREDLNPIDEALAYKKIGRSRSHITNLLRLLKLAPKVRDWVSKGKISMGQARPLLAIEDEDMQINVAEMVISEDLSVRKVEAFIKELKNSGLIPDDKPAVKPARAYAIMPSKRTTPRPAESPYAARFREAERKLSGLIGAPIRIVEDGDFHQIQITFTDEGEFLKILMNMERAFTNSAANSNVTDGVRNSTDAAREAKISALRKFSTEGVLN